MELQLGSSSKEEAVTLQVTATEKVAAVGKLQWSHRWSSSGGKLQESSVGAGGELQECGWSSSSGELREQQW